MEYLIEILEALSIIVLIYAIVMAFAYVLISIIATKATKDYMKLNSLIDYEELQNSPLAPTVSVIAPAYNESPTIVDNVRSILSLHYTRLNIIIVNDGSKDDSLQKLIDTYKLVKVPFVVNNKIETKPVKGVYMSTKSIYKKLIVVDKENGGKADALNVGLNISTSKYVACIDVDCLLEQDALVKMIRPIIDRVDTKVIAVGGVVRAVNSCIVKNGRLVKVNVPKKIIARIQVLEYIRAFLLARMAWSKLSGLLIISGAFGLFDRKIAIRAGGYDHTTVGEDMELVVRMRKYMADRKEKYHVDYIPDPLCWTEVPDKMNVLFRQRNRWARGTVETILRHKKILLNPKYKTFGLLSFPYWVLFEWFTPIVEFIGLLFTLLLAIFGKIAWIYFFSIFGVVYTFTISHSIISLYYDELSFHQYKDVKDFFKLLVGVLVEPIVYHPFMVLAAIQGNFDLLFKRNKGWGEMTRTGFKKEKTD